MEEATKCARSPYPARVVVLTMVREGAMYWFRKARPGTGGREQQPLVVLWLLSLLRT